MSFDTSSQTMALAEMYAAVRLSFTWWGTKRALSGEQTEEASKPFGANSDFVAAQKRLVNTKHEAWRKVSGCRNAAREYWHSHTLPYPESGIRLIKKDQILRFDSEMERSRANLAAAVEELSVAYDDLVLEARIKLGKLFRASDYPSSIVDQFTLTWDYIEVRPPNYLKDASPAIYEEAVKRVEARFNQAVEMAEQAFIDEFGTMVHRLADRMTPGADGKNKVFRDSVVTNLVDFFGRFKDLNIGSSDALNDLVAQAEGLVKGIAPDTLRNNPELRSQIKLQMDEVFSSLQSMMSERPRRKLLEE